jgi:hypothetical protein
LIILSTYRHDLHRRNMISIISRRAAGADRHDPDALANLPSAYDVPREGV